MHKDSSIENQEKKLQSVLFNEVILEDEFWRPRLITQLNTLVPFALDRTHKAQNALKMTGDFLEGSSDEIPEPHLYRSSDLYKVMEGAAYLLHGNSNLVLERRMDSIIELISRAQQEDGYLYVAHITGSAKNHDEWGDRGMGDRPYSNVIHSHELYNMGHMYEAAIAYYRATGKDKFLKVAEKSAQHINRVFFEGDENYNEGLPVLQAPGHEEIELALVKLYQATENELYLQMAQKFIDLRGRNAVPDGQGLYSPTYAQQHLPVEDQREAVGHAVRATYLYAAMADVCSNSGIDDYNKALYSIQKNIIDTKMSITGGLGAVHGIEGFGPDYLLPNKEAYNETCAAVGNVFFNYRMFLLTKEARYMDVAEVALMNNALSGVNFEGNRFFYVNPLEADGRTPFNHGRPGRAPWFSTACCPSNIARLMPQVSGMMYAYTDDEIYVSLYAGNRTSINLKNGRVGLVQKTNYPYNGKISIEILVDHPLEFDLNLRVPTWAYANKFVPGDLYHFENAIKKKSSLKLNGKEVQGNFEKGFVRLSRLWKKGDIVELNLAMPVQINRAHHKIESSQDKIAFTRGPLVYAAEEIDNKVSVDRFYFDQIDRDSVFEVSVNGEARFNKMVKIGVNAMRMNQSMESEPEPLYLIPYFAWNNRGVGSMAVWFPTNKEQVILVDEYVTRGGKFNMVEVSSLGSLGSPGAISERRIPSSSHDSTIQPWISTKNSKEIIEITLKEASRLKSFAVYWYVNKRQGVYLPEQWKLQYYRSGQWYDLPIEPGEDFNQNESIFNRVKIKSEDKLKRLRIEIKPQSERRVGILNVDMDSN